jgi:hypothetical protein
MDSNGKVTTLFDEQGDRFIYKLCEGYLGCAMASPGLLGEMFAEHTRTRREFLRASEQQSGTTGLPVPAVNGARASVSTAPTLIRIDALHQPPASAASAAAGQGSVLKI